MLRGLKVLREDTTGRRAWIGWTGQHVTRDVLASKKTKAKGPRSVSYVSLIDGLQRRRRFFEIVSPQERRQIRDEYERVLGPELRRLQSRTG
jgi:hypothetical protein